MLNKALENWSNWGLLDEPVLVNVYRDGLNHHTGLIKSGDKHLVLKVFEHSFDRTIKAEYLASELGVSPKLYMAANNIALYEFIDDQGFRANSLAGLAQSLTHAHQCDDVSIEPFGLIEYCNSYLANANASMHQWHEILLPALNEFVEDSTPWTFCHNDLVMQNCLFSEGKAVFIDWEYAQPNNPWFDLASLIQYFNLDDVQIETLLSNYRKGWQAKVKDRIVHTSQIAVLWCDLLWHMQKRGNDYQTHHFERFERLRKLALELDLELPTQT